MQFAKGKTLENRWADCMALFKHFIRLTVDSFELTPETPLNDLCTYRNQPGGY